MAANKLLNPLTLVLSDVDNFDSWLHDLQILKCVADLEKNNKDLLFVCHFQIKLGILIGMLLYLS